VSTLERLPAVTDRHAEGLSSSIFSGEQREIIGTAYLPPTAANGHERQERA
jgi:hypothetical protein